VFVRELLQNARDAGATRVAFTIEREAERDRVRCRDDGCGMTFEHARRYLFTLYASSKRREKRAAGRFGIGFWSVLRFDPETISVRSRTTGGEGWEVTLDGSLNSVAVAPCVMLPGTEIVLERAVGDGTGEAEITRAIHGDARFLHLRDDPARQLEVTVNGRPVSADFGLPPPSLEFRQPGLRGVVALSVEPGVEVFAHGLRLRRTAFLDELLTGGDRDRRSSVELPDGLVPRVLLDSDRLQVLMARGEAREDRALRRLVGTARRELERLVRAELDRQAPQGRLARAVEWIAAGMRPRRVRLIGGAVVVGSLVGAAVGLGLRNIEWPTPGVQGGETRREASPSRPPAPGVEIVQHPYQDVARSYGGPSVDPLDHHSAVDLAYRPESARPLLAVLRLTGLEDGGRPKTGIANSGLVSYRGSPCVGECLEVEVRIVAPGGVLRLPVASGHLIDPATVRLEGEPMAVRATPAGEPAVVLQRERRGTLSYRSTPSRETRNLPVGRWPRLPEAVAWHADQLLALPVARRAAEAEVLVGEWITYDRSPPTAARHREAALKGTPVFDRALEIGAGDCDVQNALLAAVLDRAGVPSRLVIGFVGSEGRARPGLHAWVEYLDNGLWEVADASAGPPPVGEPTQPSKAARATRVAPSTENRVAAEAPPGETIGVGGSGSRVVRVATLAAVLVLVAVVGVRSVRRAGCTRRVSAPGESADMARLLRGALLRPQAYASVGALYSRPIVPTVDGSTLSLRRARRLARTGRLYRSDRRSQVARDAADRGVPVIDASRGEGRAVADLLGARDLDAWDGLVDRSRGTRATRLVETAAAGCGERWLVKVAPNAPAPVAVHEGEPLGLARATHVAVFAEESRLWRAAEEGKGRCGRAALLLATVLVDELEVAPKTRALLLADLARRTVQERVE
jgi:transglutaminase-like putative cysteine protease